MGSPRRSTDAAGARAHSSEKTAALGNLVTFAKGPCKNCKFQESPSGCPRRYGPQRSSRAACRLWVRGHGSCTEFERLFQTVVVGDGLDRVRIRRMEESLDPRRLSRRGF
jgi:hypothetical protein